MDGAAQDEITTRLTPGHTREQDLMTQGIRANRNAMFVVELRGYEIYDMLGVFEEMATMKGQSYVSVSRAVLAAETLRSRAKEKGF